MIGRLAIRSLTAHPMRSAILASGFGVGVAVMAILLGVAEVVLQQAQAPALVGGGDVVIRLAPQVPARLLLSGTLQSNTLRPRIRVAAPFHTSPLFLVGAGGTTRVSARGGIPSLERQLADTETATVEAWHDSDADDAWVHQAPESVLRQIDRFHPVPDTTEWGPSWAEWLYFNGRASSARFYLTFMVGGPLPNGRRAAGVRLQLQSGADGAAPDDRTPMRTFSAAAEVPDADVLRAPDLTIGANHVRLDGLRYRIHLDLKDDAGQRLTGDLTIEATPGRLVPPFEITGARGWRTGYVVPVTSGALSGRVIAGQQEIGFDGGTGYHDHNWGFWEGVSWQWGQVQHDDLSFIYGRVFAPREAVDPERMPGFVGAFGANGPLGHAMNVTIKEVNDNRGLPRTIEVRARGPALTVDFRFDVESAVTTTMNQAAVGSGLDFFQMRGRYAVTGSAGGRPDRVRGARLGRDVPRPRRPEGGAAPPVRQRA